MSTPTPGRPGEPRAPRIVAPEVLDDLPPDDPAARRARSDLRRIHRAMGSRTLLAAALAGGALPPPRRVLEIGCGDASLLAALAPRLHRRGWRGVQVLLLDRTPCVAPAALRRFRSVGWRARPWQVDVRDLDGQIPPVDLVVAVLFLHHLDDDALRALLRWVATHARAMVALEPRRSAVAAVASRLTGLLGASAMTRHDARVSVAAGFRDGELRALWPAPPEAATGWSLHEGPAGPFSHLFTARRRHGSA